MSSSMQQIAELKAEIADLTAKNAALQRGGGNGGSGNGGGTAAVDGAALGRMIADIVEERLQRSERGLREDFVGKFSGILSPLLERLTDRVVTLERMSAQAEAQLSQLDDRFKDHLENMAGVIASKTRAMSAEVGRHTKAAGEEMERLYRSNQSTLEAQMNHAARAVAAAEALGVRMDEMGRRLGAVETGSGKSAAKVEAAVKRFEAVTAGELTAASEAARQKIEESAALADRLMTQSRTRFRRAAMGLEMTLVEHPRRLVFGWGVILIITCALVSAGGAWVAYDRQNKMMFTGLAEALRERLSPLVQTADRRAAEGESAERWDALTKGMNYEQQKQFFATMQKQAKAQGRNVETPKSLQK